ncbi:hypothetical protein T265_09324 [Opisthorchis viverrini]|uniref:Uncharacterized protein n=1 Tax=Opisthorchis viverrini TaxID=6198 RepID=A0A074Z6B6_OPIVI|nr:hypothetical protein T265_09324 [Opisthorchis viverrini]KER22618.1 hypothetical protein T265_09324 [Opisthorchis viverrini]
MVTENRVASENNPWAAEINLVSTRDPAESPVSYDILQLNVLHTGHLMFPLALCSVYRTESTLTTYVICRKLFTKLIPFTLWKKNRSAVTPIRRLAPMLPEGCTRAGILPGCLSLDRGSQEAEVEFEPQVFRSLNSCSNHLGHLAPTLWSPYKMLQLDCLQTRTATLLLKILRQPTTGSALLETQEVGILREFSSTPCSTRTITART